MMLYKILHLNINDFKHSIIQHFIDNNYLIEYSVIVLGDGVHL